MSNIVKYQNYETTYKTDEGKIIDLNATIVREVIAAGSNITNAEIYNFMKLCEYQGLNPFLGDAYLIKYGKKAQLVTGKDVFTKRLNDHPLCKGWEAGVIVQADGKIIERKGTFYLTAEEKLVGAYFSVNREGWKDPFYWSITFSEFYREIWDKESNKYVGMAQWKDMPATMITKCAITSGARNAFPKNFCGLYGSEELGIDENDLAPDLNKVKIEIENLEDDKETTIEYKNHEQRTEYITHEQRKLLYFNAKSKNKDIEIDSTKLINYVLKDMIKQEILPENTGKSTIPKDKLDIVLNGIEAAVIKKEEKFKKQKIIDDKAVEEELKKEQDKSKDNTKDAEEAKKIFGTEDKKDKKNKKSDEEKEDTINININDIPLSKLDEEKKESSKK